MTYWNQWRPKTPSVRTWGRAPQIREMRKEGMTQREIADALKVSQAFVSQVMKRNYIEQIMSGAAWLDTRWNSFLICTRHRQNRLMNTLLYELGVANSPCRQTGLSQNVAHLDITCRVTPATTRPIMGCRVMLQAGGKFGTKRNPSTYYTSPNMNRLVQSQDG